MRTRAIIIKKEATNECDQLVTCYTEEFGKLTAIAKSILKKSSLQAMHLDVLNLVEFELIDGRAMPIIASAHSENVFPRLKKSLPALAAAGFFADLVDKLVFDNEKDNALWFFLVSFLEEADCSAGDKLALFNLFRQSQAKILGVLGYSNQIELCQTPIHSEVDEIFESLAGTKLFSLDFLYSVLNVKI